MKRLLSRAMWHVKRYRIAYAICSFIMIAAFTCGCMQSRRIEVTLRQNVWSILWILCCETALIFSLLLAAIHPLGCVLSAAVLMTKGYQTGLCLSWWISQYPKPDWRLLLMCMQSGIAACAILTGCCITAYASLRIHRQSIGERYRCILVIFMIEISCALLRCIVCASMI